MSTLDAELIAAHARGDKMALVDLYHHAAHDAPDINAACFYATHAYVFALESNHPAQATLHAFLKKHGREE